VREGGQAADQNDGAQRFVGTRRQFFVDDDDEAARLGHEVLELHAARPDEPPKQAPVYQQIMPQRARQGLRLGNFLPH